ncbi:hypothetical protein MESS2_670007 [Mesorhizobium metallidurans STM 2683]|uniref:Uncharacterized protein n=1 Tax=Mesorhizobium metallidurans STM 2683 TaxID=1297569 RepID=M5EST1_9HYPH|nr:hypothetical protein [Mesorhizobium metallidurans]CCV07989.1 hypothetical protein MESS2_670007 [Mesorhizobium metallidurans STM 2683]
MNLTYKTVQAKLRKAGIALRKKGEIHRINFLNGPENTAYYTTSLQEALDKGLAMARRAEGPQSDPPAKPREKRRTSTGRRVG